MRGTSVRRAITAIGASVAAIVTISIPLAYFAFGYSSLSRHLDSKAELSAAYLAKYVASYPGLWQYQQVRIGELLSQIDGSDSNFRKRVIDTKNRVVIDEGGSTPAPTVVVQRPAVVAGTQAAVVEIEASLRPLLLTTLFVAVFSSLLGLCSFFALRTIPLRALNRTTGQLLQTSDRFAAALANMSQGLCMYDAQGCISLFNQRYVQMFELEKIELKGRPLLEILKQNQKKGKVSNDPDLYFNRVLKSIARGQSSSSLLEMPDGRTIQVNHEPMPEGGWVSTFEDVTAQRAAQQKISHMALHDPLTNLPNRTLLIEQIEERLRQLGQGSKFALLYLDLDRFKDVNDTLGHPFGDLLLKAVADRMRGCLREGDSLARLGGDEFAIIQANVDSAEVSGLLAARLIETISAPFTVGGLSAAVGVSVGIAIGPTDGAQSDQLLKNADMALYRAKNEGKGVYRFFESEMDRLMQARRALELDLRRAMTNGEFELYFQPLVELPTTRINGFEALLRWRHPQRGLVPPLDFIPLAEETALISPIGEWVIRTACNEASKWPADIAVAVNLSPVQFARQNIVQIVLSALANSGLAAHRLELEITESVLLFDNAKTLVTLQQLRALGVKISMDDFGTGYSSLSYLRSFPFDKIKIDRSFVHDLKSHEGSQAIVRAVTGLGISLGIATTGEGVETQDEADFLIGEGCTQAQGYLFGKPMPAGMVAEFLGRPAETSNEQRRAAVA
jgi:diguanylate cyclase (GGDEF)-like protein/PAS domain S-box-containing protein